MDRGPTGGGWGHAELRPAFSGYGPNSSASASRWLTKAFERGAVVTAEPGGSTPKIELPGEESRTREFPRTAGTLPPGIDYAPRLGLPGERRSPHRRGAPAERAGGRRRVHLRRRAAGCVRRRGAIPSTRTLVELSTEAEDNETGRPRRVSCSRTHRRSAGRRLNGIRGEQRHGDGHLDEGSRRP